MPIKSELYHDNRVETTVRDEVKVNAANFDLEVSAEASPKTAWDSSIEQLSGSDEAAILPEYCFVPDLSQRLSDRDKRMLSLLIRHGGTEVKPRALGALLGEPTKATQLAVTYFLRKITKIPLLSENIERGRYGPSGYCKWMGEPAIAWWPESTSAFLKGTPYFVETADFGVSDAAGQGEEIGLYGTTRSEQFQQSHEAQVTLTSVREARLTIGGLNLKETDGNIKLFIRSKEIPVLDTSARILEIISLYTEGVELAQLRTIVQEATNREVSYESIANHIQAVQRTLEATSARGSLMVIQPDETPKSEIIVQLAGALPRKSKDWPPYLHAIKPVQILDEEELRALSKTDWTVLAECKGMDTELFYDHLRKWVALSVCSSCAVVQKCLTTVMRAEEIGENYKHGIFGGLTAPERNMLVEIKQKVGSAAYESAARYMQEKNFAAVQKPIRLSRKRSSSKDSESNVA